VKHWWKIEENTVILTNVNIYLQLVPKLEQLLPQIKILSYTNLIVDAILSFGLTKWHEHLLFLSIGQYQFI
jgi:hypothetical protein